MKKLLNRRIEITSVDNQSMYVTRDIAVINGELSCIVGARGLALFDGHTEEIIFFDNVPYVVETYLASEDVSRETFNMVKHHPQRPYHKVKFVP